MQGHVEKCPANRREIRVVTPAQSFVDQISCQRVIGIGGGASAPDVAAELIHQEDQRKTPVRLLGPTVERAPYSRLDGAPEAPGDFRIEILTAAPPEIPAVPYRLPVVSGAEPELQYVRCRNGVGLSQERFSGLRSTP